MKGDTRVRDLADARQKFLNFCDLLINRAQYEARGADRDSQDLYAAQGRAETDTVGVEEGRQLCRALSRPKNHCLRRFHNKLNPLTLLRNL